MENGLSVPLRSNNLHVVAAGGRGFESRRSHHSLPKYIFVKTSGTPECVSSLQPLRKGRRVLLPKERSATPLHFQLLEAVQEQSGYSVPAVYANIDCKV